MDQTEIRYIVRRLYDQNFLAEPWRWVPSPLDSTFFLSSNLGYLDVKFGNEEQYEIIEVEVSMTSNLPVPENHHA